MSVNDLMDQDITVGLLIMFIVIILAIPAGIAMGKKNNQEIYGDGDYQETRKMKAKVVSKRVSPHPSNQTVQVNWVVFQFENNERVELAIKDASIFGVMVEGDEGELSYQGKKFLEFRRL